MSRAADYRTSLGTTLPKVSRFGGCCLWRVKGQTPFDVTRQRRTSAKLRRPRPNPAVVEQPARRVLVAQDIQKKSLMKKGASYLVIGTALLTGTAFAYGQALGPMLIAQAPGFVPPSGVLTTQPQAPIALPPSGVLETQPTTERRVLTTQPQAPVALPPPRVLETQPTTERRAATTPRSKTKQKVQTTKRETSVTTRRHVVHWQTAARRETITRTTTVDQSIATTSTAVSTADERPRSDAIGYEYFLSQVGKGKESK